MTGQSGRLRAGTPLLISAVCLLIVGALSLAYARAHHVGAKRMLAAATQAHTVARTAQSHAELKRTLVASADRLQQRAHESGLSPHSWGERHINLRQQNLTRSEANQTLVGIARHAGQVMKLDDFELSVTRADEGLFDMPDSARQPVLLTLRGMMYFRLGQ